MNKIEIQEMDFSYTANEPILKKLNLTLDERSTAIIGQNGAGKTTFVKLLKGLLRPTQGKILFNENDIKSMTVAQISKYIGLVFQNPNDQIFKNKVIEEVMFGPLNIGMSEQEARRHSQQALAMVGLQDSEEENPYDMGLSERKLIAIASILAMDTDVVIFDEPTIAQDYKAKEKIKEIIRTLKSEGKMVLTIIHDMDFVAECFERTIVFAQGSVLLDGPTKEVFAEKEKLQQAYLEPPHVTQLCNSLGYEEVFLTVEDFVSYIKQNRENQS
ncbi:MAG: putative transporter ATP-binding protein [Caproiciproducens sp.]|jgi:energy-coupling factor transport system ATP-binding protein|nr:putative transporter ATP-binding protein [Caproiciproducens sp.]